jgi:outer membrane protein assembly factor BamB
MMNGQLFLLLAGSLWTLGGMNATAASPAALIREAKLTGGIVAQVGSADLGLKELGERFHVRLLLPNDAAVARAQAAIDQAGLTGRFTVAVWMGDRLPFADRVLNALVVAQAGSVPDSEARRALAPGGLLIAPEGVQTMPWPETIDEWTHYLYDASGNAVSKDREVAPPRSFRWWAEPMHLRSHNHGSSFTGLVTARGRLFHFLDETTYLFDSEQGGIEQRWSLVARDAFNGAILWKRPLSGYGQPFFEDQAGQAVPDYIWRTPLSLNRRLVVQGDRVYAALHYRQGPLSVLDAATGRTVREVDVGGIVDEIMAEGDRVVCRVRSEIPMPHEELRRTNVGRSQKALVEAGMSADEAKREIMSARVLDRLLAQPLERIVAVDAASGRVLWTFDAPRVGTQSLAVKDGRVVLHNYQALICLDAADGAKVWTVELPIQGRVIGVRNLLGNLLIADGKILWTSSSTGGGVCLALADGKVLWTNPRMGTTGGFAFPTGRRAIGDVVYSDSVASPFRLSDGSAAKLPQIGDMLRRGHHIRCMAGKATERYLILPHRGLEYVDLEGDDHLPCDWIRGACSYGMMPANGLSYVTPDPCSCYAGARLVGFFALASAVAPDLERAPPPDDPARLSQGPVTIASVDFDLRSGAAAWPAYRADARRTGRAATPLAAKLTTAWTRALGGSLTQATLADGNAYVVNRDAYQLLALNLADGRIHWARPFPAALDGPPTIAAPQASGTTEAYLYIGCRDGSVQCLRASDGEPVWRFLAAPLDRLTLSGDRLESLWPVSSSVLFHGGLIYAAAGRNSYLDGGIRLYALEPATGRVRHSAVLEGPWPDRQTIATAVVTEMDAKGATDAAALEAVRLRQNRQYATGYHVLGGEADLLVTDGTDIFMSQNKFDRSLTPIPLERTWYTGYIPMGGLHLMANFGLLNDTQFHRQSMIYDTAWPSYGSGPGSAARSGTVVAVGEQQAYAAQHFEGGGYATHQPGSGNRIVADTFAHGNLPGDYPGTREVFQKLRVPAGQKAFNRTEPPVWEVPTPIVVRAMLVAPDGHGGELVFCGGIVEGDNTAEWEKSTRFEGPGKLQVFTGADGALLAEYDLPACPVFDGMSAADGRLLIALVDGTIVCLGDQ